MGSKPYGRTFIARTFRASDPKSRIRLSISLALALSSRVSCSKLALRVSVPDTYALCASSQIFSHASTVFFLCGEQSDGKGGGEVVSALERRRGEVTGSKPGRGG